MTIPSPRGKVTTPARPLSMFNGVMLSDGTISKPSMRSRCAFSISQKGVVHVDWLEGIRQGLILLGVDMDVPKVGHRSISIPRGNKRILFSNSYEYSYLKSRTSEFIDKQRTIWYTDVGLKIVPRELELDPECLSNFFMGDGSTARCRNSPRTVQTCLYTQSYDRDSIELIEGKLDKLGIHTGRATDKDCRPPCSGIVITVMQDSVDTLMGLVEPFIIPSFMYKLKRKTI